MKLWPWRRSANKHDQEGILAEIEKIGETLTPNMRALRLTMTVADQMLSMGVSANSVVSRALDITETYCARPVHVDIMANLLMVSQLRGIEKEPLTLIRPVALRDVNYMTVQSIQTLVSDIRKGKVTLDAAEERLDAILEKPRRFPWWLVMMGNGVLVAGVSLMFTSSWRVILTTFIIGIVVDRLLYVLGKRSFAPFFRNIAAATFVTVVAIVLNQLAHHNVAFFEGMNPTLIVVGGIIMLVAGLAVVGAIQDAIEEYYITASARLAKAMLQTVAIVVGIMLGLYIGRKSGIGIAVSPDPLTLNTVWFQVAGAVTATIGYTISTQTSFKAIPWIGAIGGIGLYIMYSSVNWLGISIVPASGIAAAFVGLTAALTSRLWNTPSVGVIAAGIIPLVPGLMLYNGLMQLINYPPGDPLFFKALGTLFTVGTTGLAIAIGATFGSMLARPLRQKLTAARNESPFQNLMRWQIAPQAHHRLARFVLRLPKMPLHGTKVRHTSDDETPIV